MSPIRKQHTLTAFDDELVAVKSTINRMAELARSALDRAMAALAASDRASAAKVVAGDAAIDGLEDELEKLVIRTIALRAPMADDLRYLVMAIRIGAMLERAGDHAKNIAKRVLAADMSELGAVLEPLQEMGRLAGSMIGEAIDSFNREAAELALSVRERDAELDDRLDALTGQVTKAMAAETGFVIAGVHALFIAKQLERTGDYATNIANSVFYMVTGAHFPDGAPAERLLEEVC